MLALSGDTAPLIVRLRRFFAWRNRQSAIFLEVQEFPLSSSTWQVYRLIALLWWAPKPYRPDEPPKVVFSGEPREQWAIKNGRVMSVASGSVLNAAISPYRAVLGDDHPVDIGSRPVRVDCRKPSQEGRRFRARIRQTT